MADFLESLTAQLGERLGLSGPEVTEIAKTKGIQLSLAVEWLGGRVEVITTCEDSRRTDLALDDLLLAAVPAIEADLKDARGAR